MAINGRHGRHFLLMAGLGIDGAVMARVSKPLKHRLGPLAVAAAALRALPAVRPAAAQVDLDGVSWQGSIYQLVAGNTQRYGGFARLTPAARIDDAQLDLCLITASGPAAACRQAASVLFRGSPDPSSAETYRAGCVTVRVAGVLPLQVDGGRVAQKHVKPDGDGVTYSFSARPAALAVLVPRTYAGTLFGEGGLGTPAQATLSRNGQGHDGKTHRVRLRLTSVGVERLTGTSWADGRPLTVLLGPGTTAKDTAGHRQPIDAFIVGLRQGDVLKVKGELNRELGMMLARRLKLRPSRDLES